MEISKTFARWALCAILFTTHAFAEPGPSLNTGNCVFAEQISSTNHTGVPQALLHGEVRRVFVILQAVYTAASSVTSLALGGLQLNNTWTQRDTRSVQGSTLWGFAIDAVNNVFNLAGIVNSSLLAASVGENPVPTATWLVMISPGIALALDVANTGSYIYFTKIRNKLFSDWIFPNRHEPENYEVKLIQEGDKWRLVWGGKTYLFPFSRAVQVRDPAYFSSYVEVNPELVEGARSWSRCLIDLCGGRNPSGGEGQPLLQYGAGGSDEALLAEERQNPSAPACLDRMSANSLFHHIFEAPESEHSHEHDELADFWRQLSARGYSYEIHEISVGRSSDSKLDPRHWGSYGVSVLGVQMDAWGKSKPMNLYFHASGKIRVSGEAVVH